MMKRSVVALGILGLVYAMALPGASAAVLYKDDFSTDALLKNKDTYIQGRGSAILNDTSILPFYIRDGQLWSSPEGSTTGSDNVVDSAEPGTTLRYLLLIGDPVWSDVAIESNIRIDNQGTGTLGLVLRAAPKTKPEDPDSWYEFRYTTGIPPVHPEEEDDGVEQPQSPPNLRIMKVVNGKWKVLTETDPDRASSPIPTIMNGGDNQEQGAIFRFVAKGNLLQTFIALPGEKFVKFLEATDDELKAGRVGITEYDYNPVFDNLLVEDAP
jgi:hypothetical protein